MKLLVIGILAWHFLFVLSDFTSADVNPQKVTDTVQERISRNEIFQLKDLKDTVPSFRKAPRFMMELYDAVAGSNGTLKTTKVLEGNVVRSFKGA